MAKPSAVVLPRRIGPSALRSSSLSSSSSTAAATASSPTWMGSSSSSSASSAKVTEAFSLPAAASELIPEEHLEPLLELPGGAPSAANSNVAEVITALADPDTPRSSSSATAAAATRIRRSPSPTPSETPSVGWSSTPSLSTNPRDLRHRHCFRHPQRRVLLDAPSSPKSQAAEAAADGEAPLPEPIVAFLAELHGERGLSPLSERLLSALADASVFELAPAATACRLRRAAFWGKVRVAVLAATVSFVLAVDVALAVHLLSRRADDGVPPPT